MPYIEYPGGGRYYTYLTTVDEAAFWQKNPDAGGVPLPTRAILDGAKSITIRPVEDHPPATEDL